MTDNIRESDVVAPYQEDDLYQFGLRVSELREKKGWKQNELSRRTKIGATRLSRIERGIVQARLGELVKLQRALGAPLDELVFGDQPSALAGGDEERLARALREVLPAEDRDAVLRFLRAGVDGYRQLHRPDGPRRGRP